MAHVVTSCSCSVTKPCPTLGDPKAYSMPGFPAFHYLLEFVQTHVPLCGSCYPTILSSVASFFCPQSFPESGCFSMSRSLTSGDQSIGASASTSPGSPWDFQESSPTPQLKSINSSVLSFLHSPNHFMICI